MQEDNEKYTMIILFLKLLGSIKLENVLQLDFLFFIMLYLILANFGLIILNKV